MPVSLGRQGITDHVATFIRPLCQQNHFLQLLLGKGQAFLDDRVHLRFAFDIDGTVQQ